MRRIVRLDPDGYTDERLAEQALLSAWLCGSGGALFDAVRTRAGAAYTPQCGYIPGETPWSPASLAVFVHPTPGTEADAVQMVLDLLGRTSITGDEWRTAMQVATEQTRVDSGFRGLPRRVRTARQRGFDRDLDALTAEGLSRATREDFEDCLAEQTANPAVMFVGSAWRLDDLARLGEVRRVDIGR